MDPCKVKPTSNINDETLVNFIKQSTQKRGKRRERERERERGGFT
jgi:hypothetical protein